MLTTRASQHFPRAAPQTPYGVAVSDGVDVQQDVAPIPVDEAAPEPRRLDFPADGVPDVVADEASYLRAVAALAAGTGPVAVDAERASGYRYGQRAYLVQLRREGGHLADRPGRLP